MNIVPQANISLQSSESLLQSQTYLSIVTFNKQHKRNQLLYYRELQEIELHKPFEITRNDPWIGIILVKYSKIDNKWYQWPLWLIETSKSINVDLPITISNELIYRLPWGKAWKKSVKFEDFTEIFDGKIPEEPPSYLLNDGFNFIITEDGDRLVLEFI